MGKNIKKFLKDILSAKSTTKPQYKKYVDDVASLYEQGKITKPRVHKLLTQLVSTSVRHAIKFIEDNKVKEKKIKKTPQPKKEPIQTYHLNAKFLLRTITYSGDTKYYVNDKDADELTDFYFKTFITEYPENIPKKFRHYRFHMAYKMEEYADTFHGTYGDCVNLLKDKIEEEYKHNNGYFRIDVLLFYSITNITPDSIVKKYTRNIKMKSATPLLYANLFSGVDIFHTNTGKCVIDCIKNRYPHIDINKFYESCGKVEAVNIDEGFSSEQVLQFCKDFDISMYAFDIQRKCFLKHISKNRNDKAFVYFCINQHMYNVIDSDEIK
jgi:hypothetical protein